MKYRITESKLRGMIREAVMSALNEGLTPSFKHIAKRHGGVQWLDKNYQFDKLESGLWDVFFEAKDIPYNLYRFANEVMRFNDGTKLYAIKPEYHNDERVKEMLKSSGELSDLRTDRGGYEPGTEKDEIEVDYGGGPFWKTFNRTVSPNDMRMKAHAKSRGKKKPLAKSSGDDDYNDYVRRYLCDKFNGVYLDGYIAVPVSDLWSDEAEAIRKVFRKYGYGEDESIGDSDVEYDLKYDDTGYQFDPDSSYLTFTRGNQKAYMEWDDSFGPYATYRSSKLPPAPKIGTTEFMKTK